MATTTLHDLVARTRAAGQRLPANEAAVLFGAVMRLAAAQAATLRPRLVQLDEQGNLRLSPFDDRQPDADPAYLAPELLSGEVQRKSDPRVQVFAAGVLGCELLSGRPDAGAKELAGPLGDILRMAVAPDRRERFGDLGQLSDAVEGVQRKLAPADEQKLLAGLRARVLRLGAPAPAPEKEALAKVIEKLNGLERAHRQSLERLDRLEEGLRRADEARRKRQPVVLPAVIFGTLSGAAAVFGIWSAGMLGAAARPQVVAQPAAAPPQAATSSPSPTPTAPAQPTPTHSQPAEVERPPESPDASAAEAPPAPDAGATAAAEDAGTADAGAAAAAPTQPAPAPAAPAPKKRSDPQVSQRALAHAVALSQVKRGDRALEQNQLDEALASYRTALENEPTLPDAFRGLGTAYTLQGNEKLAEQNYERYLQLAPRAKDAADIRRALSELRARAHATQAPDEDAK